MPRGPRYRTGDRRLDEAIADLVTAAGPSSDDDLLFELIVSAVRMRREGVDRGDLKLVNAALKELRYSFHLFEPYRAARKLTIFGSARIAPGQPAYLAARGLEARGKAAGRRCVHHPRRLWRRRRGGGPQPGRGRRKSADADRTAPCG